MKKYYQEGCVVPWGEGMLRWGVWSGGGGYAQVGCVVIPCCRGPQAQVALSEHHQRRLQLKQRMQEEEEEESGSE